MLNHQRESISNLIEKIRDEEFERHEKLIKSNKLVTLVSIVFFKFIFIKVFREDHKKD